MGGFRNAILGGVNLIRSAIRSPNYVSGSTGWTINQDGTAEFNSVTIRGGTVIGGTALYYSGTPAAGNLIMSISASAGTDTYGNTYVAGVGAYGTSDKVTVRSSGGNTAVLRADAPSYVADSTAPGLELRRSSEAGDGASITEYDDTFDHGLLLLSPSPVHGGAGGSDFAYMQMIGRFSTDPAIALYANGTNSTISLNNTLFDSTGEAIAYAGGTFHTFTPTVGGDGTATYSTRTGWWQRVGAMRYVCIYLVANGAGSGVANVTVTVPFTVDRTTRQVLTVHAESVGVNGGGAAVIRGGECVFFSGGSGGTADRIRVDDRDGDGENNLLGVDIGATSIITIQGWLREAI